MNDHISAALDFASRDVNRLREELNRGKSAPDSPEDWKATGPTICLANRGRFTTDYVHGANVMKTQCRDYYVTKMEFFCELGHSDYGQHLMTGISLK